MQYLQKFISKDPSFGYTLGERISSSDVVFNLYEGKSKEDGSRVLILALEDSSLPSRGLSATARNGLARAAAQRLKTLRHPDVLKFLDEKEGADGTMYIATEWAVPLDVHMAECKLGAQEIQWGLMCLSRALGFMHSSKLVHGAVCPSSVFVTTGGNWKLGGFAFTTPLASAQALRQAINFVPPPYVSPELTKGDVQSILDAPTSATDSWAFGCLVHEVFSGEGKELTDCSKLPRRLVPAYQRLLSSKPATRAPVGDLPQHPYFKNSAFVEMNLFMETAALKGEFERETFFRKLVTMIPNLPRGFCVNKLLPLLSQTIETKQGAAAAAAAAASSSTVAAIKSLAGVQSTSSIGAAARNTPGVSISGTTSAATAAAAFEAVEAMRALLGEDDFRTEVAGKYAVRWYGDQGVDRHVKVSMYNSISHYVGGMDDSGLNGPVFSAMSASFGDAASPAVRDAAVKAVLVLARRLSSRNLNTSLMAHFARLQVDTEPAIRTNTTVCLGKLANKLSAGVRNKVLVPAFLRALKDPFPPAKTGALGALMETAAFFSIGDLAQKVLPATVPLMIDPDESVRTNAFKVFDLFKDKLEENHRQLSERGQLAGPQNQNGLSSIANEVPGTTSIGTSKYSGGGWGLSSLGGLASALLNKEAGTGTSGALKSSTGISSADFARTGAGVGFGSDSRLPQVSAASHQASNVTGTSTTKPIRTGLSLGNGPGSTSLPESSSPDAGSFGEFKASSSFADDDDLLLDDDNDEDAWGSMEVKEDLVGSSSKNQSTQEPTQQTEEDIFVSMMAPTNAVRKPSSDFLGGSGSVPGPTQRLPTNPSMGIQLATSNQRKKASNAGHDWGALLGGTGASSRRRQRGLGARRR